MNTLNGYSKSTLTDTYVLTAAGGHLAVGNAANNIPLNNSTVNTNLNADLLDGKHASGLLTALSSNTTNKVSLTVGGTTKNITTLYASYLCSVGTVVPLTKRTQAYGNVYSYHTNASAYTGAPTTYTATIGFGKGTEGTVEICGEWTSGRGLWVRALKDTIDDWYAWDRILTEATYSKVLDNRYYTETEVNNKLAGYLPLAGGTMNNGAAITIQNQSNIIHTTVSTSNAVRTIQWYKGSTHDTTYTYPACLGWHNTGNTDGAIYLVPNPQNSEPWGGSVGLYIGKTLFKWNNNAIIHAGNYTTYTVKKDGTGASGTWNISISGNSDTSAKLNMTSIISYDELTPVGVYGYTNTNSDAASNGYPHGNTSAAIVWGKDNCKVILAARAGRNSSEVYIRQYYTDWGSWFKLLHSGNTYISSGTITINGTSITPLTAHQSLANCYLIKGAMGSSSTAWDWNSYTTLGSYKVLTGTTITNHPKHNGSDDAYPFGIAYVIRGQSSDSGNRTVQMYFPHSWTNYSNIPLYLRMLNGSDWTLWARIPSVEYINTTNFPGLNKTGTVTSVTVTGANGLSGTGTITTSGTITLSNAGVRSTTINGNYLIVNTNGTNADLTIPYATTASLLNNTYVSNPSKAASDKNVKWYSQISNSSGYAGTNYGFPVSNNANGILWLGTHSGLYGWLMGFSSNGHIYARYISNNSFSTTANGGSWGRIAWASDIPAVTDYYWANIKVSSSSSTTTTPTFGGATITGTTKTKRVNIYGGEVTDGSKGLYFLASDDSGRARLYYNGNTDTGTLGLESYYSNIVIMPPSGKNVGIGTTSPTQKLHVNGNAMATNLGVNALGGGNGISLYNGVGSVANYGIAFNQTSNWGTHGYVTADWATYFTMNDLNSRGWIFRRNGSGNVFSIDTSGLVYANGRINGSYYTSRVATGTQPYACTSTTLNTNLNADLLDGFHKNDILETLWKPTIDLNTLLQKSGFVETSYDNVGAANITNLPFANKATTVITTPGAYGFLIAHVYNSETGFKIRGFYRETFYAWKTLAFTDSDITGNAATASLLKNNSTTTYSQISLLFYGGTLKYSSNSTDRSINSAYGKYTSGTEDYGSIIRINYSDKYYTDFFVDANGTDLAYKRVIKGSTGGWRILLDSNNSGVSGGGSSGGSSITVKINGTSKTLTIPTSLPANGGTSEYYSKGPSSTYTNTWDCNAPDRIVYSDYGSSGRSVTNAPSGWLYGTLLELGHMNYRGLNGTLNMQLMWDVAHNTTNGGTLWFRGKCSSKNWDKSWCKVLTDQNSSVSGGGSSWGSSITVNIGGTSKTLTIPSNPNTDTKVTNTLATTTKFYLTGTSSASTNTGTLYFDTGIYSTTTAGLLFTTSLVVNSKLNIDSTGRVVPAGTGVRNAGVYGVYDSTKVGHIWSMGIDYKISEDGSSTGNTYGLIYFHTNWSNSSTNNATQRDGALITEVSSYAYGHQIALALKGLIYASLGNYIWSRNGFIKKDSNNNYILLGGGGHKLISDFSMSHSHPYIPLSGGTLSSGSAQIQRAGSPVSWYLGRSNAMLRINSYSGYNAIASMKTTNGDWSLGVYSNDTLYFTYVTDTNFNANTNTTTAQVSINASGNLYATHFYENSDEQLKTNIQEILNSDKMPIIKEFDWKESNSHSYGLIAQELEELGYSELVSVKDDGYKTVNYSAALSLIVGKLQVKIRELEKEIENLKNKN